MVNQVTQPSIDQFISNIVGSGGFSKPSRFLVSVAPPPCIQSIAPNNKGSLPMNSLFNFNFISQFGNIASSNFGGGQAGGATALMLACDETEMPGVTIATNDIKIYGPSRRQPYQRIYNDWTASFLVTNDFTEKSFFDFWVECINPNSAFDFNYYDDYVSTINIYQFDEGGNDGTGGGILGGLSGAVGGGFGSVGSIGGSIVNGVPAGLGGTFINQNLGGSIGITGPLGSSSVVCQVNLIEAYPIAINAMRLGWGIPGFHRLDVTFAYRYWENQDIQDNTASILPSGGNGIFPSISGVLGGTTGILTGGLGF